MLTARDKDGVKTIAHRARREDDYFCPSCSEKMILKKGSIRIPHFSHTAESVCQYMVGETELHREMKVVLRDYYLKALYVKRVELECYLDGLVADLYVELKEGKRIAIEFQVSPIDVRDLMRKTVLFSRHSVHVLWILGGQEKLDICISRLRYAGGDASLPYRSNEIESRLQQLYYGRFYYYFSGKIYPAHMEEEVRWTSSSCDGCPEEFSCPADKKKGCPLYRPGFMSRMTKKRQLTIGMLRSYRPVCMERKGGLKLARFMDKKWWSNTFVEKEDRHA